MEELLSQASKLGYIDGIMMTYNFRNMHTPKMKAAVEACVKAGIGLTAMKTQAKRSWKSLNKANNLGEQMMESFIAKGLTEEQAKLKAVWTTPHIAAICLIHYADIPYRITHKRVIKQCQSLDKDHFHHTGF
jgi:hypothetical protein